MTSRGQWYVREAQNIENMDARYEYIERRVRNYQRCANRLLCVLPLEMREAIIKDLCTVSLGIRPLDMDLSTFTDKVKFLTTDRTGTYELVRPDITTEEVVEMYKTMSMREIAKHFECSTWTIFTRLRLAERKISEADIADR